MAEEVFVIAAGDTPVTEVVISEDRETVTIRDADDHEHSYQIMSSMVAALITRLRDVERALAH